MSAATTAGGPGERGRSRSMSPPRRARRPAGQVPRPRLRCSRPRSRSGTASRSGRSSRPVPTTAVVGLLLELVPGGESSVGRPRGLPRHRRALAARSRLRRAARTCFRARISSSSPVDAYFEAMSGFTTTGASVVTDVDEPARVARRCGGSSPVWLGGMGIIVLALAVLPRLRVAGRQLFESGGRGPGDRDADGDDPRDRPALRPALPRAHRVDDPRRSASSAGPGSTTAMNLYEAVAHTFTTLGTGGFSTQPRSMEAFAPVTQWIVIVFLVAAGTNYALMFHGLVRRRRRAVRPRPGVPALHRDPARCGTALLLAELLGRGDRARRGGGPLRRLPGRFDHHDDRLRQRRLQHVDGADERDDRRADVLRCLRRVDDRVDQGRAAHLLRRPDPAPGARADRAPGARQLGAA